jgi:hypothetical protein
MVELIETHRSTAGALQSQSDNQIVESSPLRRVVLLRPLGRNTMLVCHSLQVPARPCPHRRAPAPVRTRLAALDMPAGLHELEPAEMLQRARCSGDGRVYEQVQLADSFASTAVPESPEWKEQQQHSSPNSPRMRQAMTHAPGSAGVYVRVNP